MRTSSSILFCLAMVLYSGGFAFQNSTRRILKVPAEFPTISEAVMNAAAGDWVIISPGSYAEKEIVIDKKITVSSEWKLTGDKLKIDETVIDAGNKSLFIIIADSVEISGLHVVNGNHTLDIQANATIMHNHFVRNLDPLSFEGPGGGYAGYNLIENDRDDGIDSDIRYGGRNKGTDLLIEQNVIINSNDDGIEIRLYDNPDQNINYIIRENTIIGSRRAGIQLISYDKFTGKTFQIHHNLISECKTGLGCMEGSRTAEDLTGASKMDERVWFYNNTLVGNQMGATGGNQIIAFNNVVQGNTLGGFKRFGRNSAVINNLFYNNSGSDLIEISDSAATRENIFSVNPSLASDGFMPGEDSRCIDAGKAKIEANGVSLEIAGRYVAGSAPDLGAIERNGVYSLAYRKLHLLVDAGQDLFIKAPAMESRLRGRISGVGGAGEFSCLWKLESGPEGVVIEHPESPETKAIFKHNGIYAFSLTGAAKGETMSDHITIRNFSDGDGKDLFLDQESKGMIDAVDYAYAYGRVSVGTEAGDKQFIDITKSEVGGSFVEYSVGIAENDAFTLWALLKNQRKENSQVEVTFNNLEPVRFAAPKTRKWKWVKIPGEIIMTAGQWPLLVGTKEGSAQVKKIFFSRDPDFKPKQ